MREERAKNAGRNIIFGCVLKVYQILVPFFMRTAMIHYMGVQYLGLNSLFVSVLQVLNLAELGVGSAMVYSMYKPIVDEDRDMICALMGLYRKYYRIIGSVIAIIGTLITPIIPSLIKSDLPENLSVYVLYFINLSGTVVSYWLYAYKGCLLQAHQRSDILSKITLVTSTLRYLLEFLCLAIFQNFYFYTAIHVFTQVLTNFFIAKRTKKLYPDYQPIGSLPLPIVNDINQRIKDLFTTKLGTIVVGSADTIVISAYLGLTTLATYQNYYFILNAVYGFIGIILTSVLAGIGNSLVTETIEKNYIDLKKLTFIVSWIICICSCCFIVLYQPFMKLWVGEALMLDNLYVILFCVYFYVCELSMIWATVKDAAGLWHSDRFRTLIGALCNLILNIILVQEIGLYGVLLSTILSYVLITMPWLLRNLFKLLYKRNIKEYLLILAQYLGVTILSTICTVLISMNLKVSGIMGLLLNAVVALTIPNVIQLVFFHQKAEFLQTFELVKRILKKS